MDPFYEASLAILLDAAPHLQELHLRAHRLPSNLIDCKPLPWDVLQWAGR